MNKLFNYLHYHTRTPLFTSVFKKKFFSIAHTINLFYSILIYTVLFTQYTYKFPSVLKYECHSFLMNVIHSLYRKTWKISPNKMTANVAFNTIQSSQNLHELIQNSIHIQGEYILLSMYVRIRTALIIYHTQVAYEWQY